MHKSRTSKLAALAATSILALAACGSEASGSTDASGSIGGQPCASGSLKSSGSSAQANAMTEWINAYQQACAGVQIDYQPNGSGAGIQDFINAQTNFAGSDSAMAGEDQTKADTRCGSGNQAINVPAVGGAIVIAYNLEGVDKLIVTPQILTGIFENTITTWNDPAVAEANPGVTLPDATIAQIHRSDSSGTTDNFTKFLTATGGWSGPGGKDWTAQGGQGQKGSDGVTSAVKSTPNSIGYMELSYAQSSSLDTAWLDNGGGPIEATSETAAATISAAAVTGSGNNLPLSIDYTTTTSYPMVLVTYEIVCEKGSDSATVALLESFLSYTASSDGQSELTKIGYVPITGDLLTKVQAAFASIA